MKQTWANPNPAGGAYGRVGNLYTDVIFVERLQAPTSSPAPAPGTPGNLAGIVPLGWIFQIGNDGEVDTMLADARSGVTVQKALISQWIVPYDGWAAWPPDPQAGQPGHTAQRPTGQG